MERKSKMAPKQKTLNGKEAVVTKKSPKKKAKDSEFQSYIYIKNTLRDLGWNTGNPSRTPSGQLYTQQECLRHSEIAKRLGKKHPEYIVKVTGTDFWVIEAKTVRPDLNKALTEAKERAELVNKSEIIKARIISGVAGNETDGYSVRTQFLEADGQFHTVLSNGQEMSGLISRAIAQRLFETNSSSIQDVAIDQKLFLTKAERINEILHEGAIPIHQRARVMSALLLSFLDDTPPNLSAAPSVLIGDINARILRVLRRQGKPDFLDYIRLSLPTTESNHLKFKQALVDTWTELEGLSIRTAMNSGTDILGQFYEVFLKYGKGAKEMGIVLTPRHVTRFVAEALSIRLQDIIFDPTVGTAGFLVAAFDAVKSNATATQIEQFKQNNVYGIDQNAEVVSLAVVNMIFRGDGKNNIIEANCFSKALVRHIKDERKVTEFIDVDKRVASDSNVVTKVLMNPSFKQEATDEPEYRFVNYALDQMADGELLFSVLPMSAMFEQGEERDWRENQLLRNNTLLAVITLPPELFYPVVSVHSLGIFVRKGIPHPRQQKVLWMRAIHDGYRKIKKKRLIFEYEPNDLNTVLPILKAYLQNPDFPVNSTPELMKVVPIDWNGTLLELVPEVYLDSKQANDSDLKEGMEKLAKETISHLIRKGSISEM